MRGYLVASGIAGSSQRSGASARRRLSADRYVAQRRKREKSAVEQVKIMPARERPLPRTLRPTDLTPAADLAASGPGIIRQALCHTSTQPRVAAETRMRSPK